MPIEYSIDIDVPAEQVFKVYTDVSAWPDWDPDLHAAGIDGPFTTGSTGWIKPIKGPRMKTNLIQVTPGYAFTARSRLPFCIMDFTHRIDSADNPALARVSVTHGVTFQGMLAPLFRRIVGSQIEKALPAAMQGLKAYTEKQYAESSAISAERDT
jgi:hypothetical protein